MGMSAGTGLRVPTVRANSGNGTVDAQRSRLECDTLQWSVVTGSRSVWALGCWMQVGRKQIETLVCRSRRESRLGLGR
jgi:hypothetical protein